jgi:hypothetical protein
MSEITLTTNASITIQSTPGLDEKWGWESREQAPHLIQAQKDAWYSREEQDQEDTWYYAGCKTAAQGHRWVEALAGFLGVLTSGQGSSAWGLDWERAWWGWKMLPEAGGGPDGDWKVDQKEAIQPPNHSLPAFIS